MKRIGWFHIFDIISLSSIGTNTEGNL